MFPLQEVSKPADLPEPDRDSDGKSMEKEKNTIDQKHVESLLRLFKYAGKLKSIKRTGWVERNIENPESVAEHSFRTALMAIFTGDGFDMKKLLITALIHDLCESITGDLTPRNGVDPELKKQKEFQALRQILGNLDPNGYFHQLWRHFADESSPEGKFVKQLDKLEMALQASEYAETGHEGLTEFLECADENIENPLLKELLIRLKKVD